MQLLLYIYLFSKNFIYFNYLKCANYWNYHFIYYYFILQIFFVFYIISDSGIFNIFFSLSIVILIIAQWANTNGIPPPSMVGTIPSFIFFFLSSSFFVVERENASAAAVPTHTYYLPIMLDRLKISATGALALTQYGEFFYSDRYN